MRTILLIALFDLRQALRDRSGLVWMLLMPVVFAAFFGLVIRSGSSDPIDAKARLTVVDHDQGVLARLLISGLANERLEVVEIPADQQAVTESKVRTLVIPAGFSDSVARGEQVTLRLEKEPGTSPEAALVAQARIMAVVSRLISRLIGVAAETSATPAAETAATTSATTLRPETIDQAQVQELATPAQDLVRVEARFAGHRHPPGGFAQSAPGMVVMFVLLVALTYGAASLTEERSGGRLQRLATAPVLPREIVFGKIAGRLVVAVTQISVLVVVAWLAQLGLDKPIVTNVLSVWIVLICYAVAVAPLGVLFGAWFRDPDRAANMGAITTMVLAAFGGCWWPIEIVSRPLQLVALLLPTGWAMRGLHGLISYGRGLQEIVPVLLILLGFAVVCSVLAGRLLRIE